MSRGIDFSKLQPEDEDQQPATVRHIMMATSLEDLRKLTDEAKKTYPFFGVLLPHPQAHQVSDYIRTYWQRLHQMSGSACLMVTPLPPEQPTSEMRQFLVNVLGEQEAAKAWHKYHYDPQKVQDQTYELAEQANVDYNRLPCLVLMSDLDSHHKLVQRVPAWGPDDLTGFFEELFTRVMHHRSELDPAKRLDALKGDLGMGFMLKLQAAHAARGIRISVAQVEWSEIIKSTLTNDALLTGVFKAAFAAFGVPIG